MEENSSKKQRGLIIFLVAVIFILILFIAGQKRDQNIIGTDKTAYKQSEDETKSYKGDNNYLEDDTSAQESDIPETEETIENNSYFQVIDIAGYKDILSDQIAIIKVLGKQNVTCDLTIVVYDAKGDVIDKATSGI